MTDELPLYIGKYRILSMAGKGAMGVVYKGIDPVIHRHVAIKTLSKRSLEMDEAQVADRFIQEAKAAGQLSHPNIVGVYEYGEDDEQAFIAMEFVEGHTLSKFIEVNERLDSGKISRIMIQMLDALHYAHSKGVVHRDIKPSNIIITPENVLKITDFGIARLESSSLTQLGTVLGTPGYMSPEQLLGENVDNRSDIFSAGVLFYELLTGTRPFGSTNYASIVYKIVHSELPAPSIVNPVLPIAFDTIINTALAKNPANRYQTAREFSEAIDDIGWSALTHVRENDIIGDPNYKETAVIPPFAQHGEQTVNVTQKSATAPDTDIDATVVAPRFHTHSEPVPTPTPAVQKKKSLFLYLTAVVVLMISLLVVYLMQGKNVGTKFQDDLPPAITELEPVVEPKVPIEVVVTPVVPKLLPGASFQDCDSCPIMVVVPTGTFFEGSPYSETDREKSEGPIHSVNISYTFAIGRFEVTNEQFHRFVQETGYESRGCISYDDEWKMNNDLSWRMPGYTQTGLHPVTCVSWDDAQAYTKWLTKVTDKEYRLPSSSEWEYSARAGSEAPNGWGERNDLACNNANVADRTAEKKFNGWKIHDCNDDNVFTAPVGSFSPNEFGVHDTLGNVFEWVQDCWNESYEGAPEDGAPWSQGDCNQRILRGGSWYSRPRYVRHAYRNRFSPVTRSSSFGFRVALTLPTD